MNKQQIVDEAREALLEMLERERGRRAAIAHAKIQNAQ